MPRRVLVRTENEKFGRSIKAHLRRRGARVKVTSSLNDAGYAILNSRRGSKAKNCSSDFLAMQYDIPLSDRILLKVWEKSSELGGRRARSFLGLDTFDFIIFDPLASRQDINPILQYYDGRALRDNYYCQGDADVRHSFPEDMPLGWERNFLGYKHFLTKARLESLPDELVRGIAFLQELKEAGRYDGGGHPDFPLVVAGVGKEARWFADALHSYGFVDTSRDIEFERLSESRLLELDENSLAAYERIFGQFAAPARIAVAASALAIAQPAMESARIIAPVAYAQTHAQQPEIKITSNNAQGGGDFNCVGYWIGGPRARVCSNDATNPFENVSFGLYLPPSKSRVKIVGSRINGKEDFGAYFNQQFLDGISIGFGGEFYDGKFSLEGHSIIPMPLVDRIYVGYSNNGEQTLVLAVQPDIGDMRFALLCSAGEVDQWKGYGAKKGWFKFFYTDDRKKKTQLLNGFVRFGKPIGPYLEGGMSGERFDITQAPNVHTAGMLFNAALFPDNTHLSDHGWLAVAPRILFAQDGTTFGLRTFYTHGGRLIAGYAITRMEKGGLAEYGHTLSGGANIGPFKAIGSYETGRGPGVYAQFSAKVR